ncbi:unnamed protein product, partial [Rotaria sp. Silwood1]
MSQQSRRRHPENYMVIWVDGNMDMTNKDCQNTMEQLRGVVNQVNLCTTAEECIQQLNKNPEEISFVISSGALGQHLVPSIHGMAKLNAIYICCDNKQEHEIWTKSWAKIKGVHTTIKHICEKLAIAIKQCNQDHMPVSSAPFASIREESYFKDEEEILFSMHTVFRIGEVRKIDNNRALYQVDLKLTSDDDPQLRELTDFIREE